MLALRALLCAAAIAGSATSPIEHFAVLFMENRAFDHIFGCATKLLPGIDGITGNGRQLTTVFNRFYAAIPGPSQPNHMFAQSGTACGATETGINYWQCGGLLPVFPQRTIYDALLDAGKDFAIYVNGTLEEGGIPGDLYMWGLLRHIIGRAHTFEEHAGFFAAAAAGTLPALSWILPRNGGDHPNDDHPCHDVALGEQLLKSVYEALRAGPLWPKTALFVVYDDPGGFADHMPTPVTAPPPAAPCDKKSVPDKFAFDRLGIRLTNLLISPAVAKGTVLQDPEGPAGTAVRPAADSKFELSSIPATLKNLFGLPRFLTKRDAWAGSFHEVFNLSAPRTDCPTQLPDAPRPTVGVPAVHGCGDPSLVTRRQRRHLTLVASLLEKQCPNPERMTRRGADAWLAEHLPLLMRKLEVGGLAHFAEEADQLARFAEEGSEEELVV